MRNRTTKAGEAAWRIAEWMTVFTGMVCALAWGGRRRRSPPASGARRVRAAPVPPVLWPGSEEPDGGATFERARRRRHVD